MGSAITQPIKRFFSKDKAEQNSLTNNGNSSEKRDNGSETSDDDSVPAQSKESEIASGESTCTILSSEDEEPPKPGNTCGDPTELKKEVKENIISEKDDLWSKVEKYENNVRGEQLGVSCDDQKTQNEDRRPNIFDLRYKSSNSEESNEPAIEGDANFGQLELNESPSSEQEIVESEPVISTSQTPDSSKDHVPEFIQSKITDANPLPSHTVLSDEVVKSPVNNNRPNPSGNHNKNNYHHHIDENTPAIVKDSTWMKHQVRKLYTPYSNINTLKEDNYIRYREGPSLGVSVFTQLKANRAMSSNPDSKNRTTITTKMPKEVSLPKGSKLFKQNKSQLDKISSSSSVEKNKLSFKDWYPLPGGGYTLYEKKTDPKTDSQINELTNRGIINQYGNNQQASGIIRKEKLKEFDIYRFRVRMSAVNNRKHPVNYRSKNLHTTSELSSEHTVPETRVTDH